jgi:glycosyltransferase involved in cell wall biosynthesis
MMMEEADALLLINEPRLERYLPGKLYDYIAAGTPILVYGEGGESADLVAELRVGSVLADGNSQGLEQFLDSLLENHPETSEKSRQWLASHTREATSKLMLQALEGVLRI